MAFPHHGRKKRPHPRLGRERPARCANQKRGTLWRRVRTLLPRPRRRYSPISPTPRPSTATRKASWKAPLWQALTEAGLPLAWVPEDCGGSGASLAEGFGVLSAAGRFAIAVPLAETMLAGWLLAQAKIASPEGEMTVAPASPKDRITLNADGTSRAAPAAFPSPRRQSTSRCWPRTPKARLDRAGRCRQVPDRGRPQSRRRQQRHRDVRQGRSRSPSSRRRRVSTRPR